ncbi:hypothetical protein BJG93_35135 [Paraburkholderia sprentiae WSM5005]|uniref:Transposase n=1 Tax=Paraburkholderia sprentiae WSM5005 TaxID=754502 RepID=A0A8F4KIA1_9BURK|nr:hypothetical protein BJG93_35135 [Paraburkholderia sprentiae WSM5005]
MMPPDNALVSALAIKTGITEQTLYTWRRQQRSLSRTDCGVAGCLPGGQRECCQAGARAASSVES